MQGLAEIASTILSRSSRSVEVYAQNIANISTPGYKRRVDFAELLEGSAPTAQETPRDKYATDFSEGKLIQTGNVSDLAVMGSGFFAVRGETGPLLYTRQGQFRRDADGRLITASGLVLQGDGGSDLVLRDGDFAVAEDGAVTSGGAAVGRIALSRFADPARAAPAGAGAFAAGGSDMIAVDHPQVRQGALESSNVSMGDEMVSVMAALRQAESGQRLMMVYDDLMGRVLTTFGQG